MSKQHSERENLSNLALIFSLVIATIGLHRVSKNLPEDWEYKKPADLAVTISIFIMMYVVAKIMFSYLCRKNPYYGQNFEQFISEHKRASADNKRLRNSTNRQPLAQTKYINDEAKRNAYRFMAEFENFNDKIGTYAEKARNLGRTEITTDFDLRIRDLKTLRKDFNSKKFQYSDFRKFHIDLKNIEERSKPRFKEIEVETQEREKKKKDDLTKEITILKRRIISHRNFLGITKENKSTHFQPGGFASKMRQHLAGRLNDLLPQQKKLIKHDENMKNLLDQCENSLTSTQLKKMNEEFAEFRDEFNNIRKMIQHIVGPTVAIPDEKDASTDQPSALSMVT